jgi:hypothetical protein
MIEQPRDSAIRRISSLPFQKMNDEILVVDPKTREVHLLNPTASRVWDLLATPQTVGDLVGALGREFEAPEETLRADVTALLQDLAGKGLIDPSGWRKDDR